MTSQREGQTISGEHSNHVCTGTQTFQAPDTPNRHIALSPSLQIFKPHLPHEIKFLWTRQGYGQGSITNTWAMTLTLGQVHC